MQTITYEYRQAPDGFGWKPVAEALATVPVETGTEAARSKWVLFGALFNRHNADDRPRGREIRSMSVGDIFTVIGPTTRHYVVAPVGWVWVPDNMHDKNVQELAKLVLFECGCEAPEHVKIACPQCQSTLLIDDDTPVRPMNARSSYCDVCDDARWTAACRHCERVNDAGAIELHLDNIDMLAAQYAASR